jgi:hypothetical protein
MPWINYGNREGFYIVVRAKLWNFTQQTNGSFSKSSNTVKKGLS